MKRWLSVVGIGEDGMAGLAPAARALVENAEVLIGGARHLAMVPPERTNSCDRLAWPSPMTDLVSRIPEMRARRVCVLATGDPMLFGVGTNLACRVAAEEMTVLPHVSAFSLAAARLGWALDRCALVTVHGRRAESVARHVVPDARLIILGHDGSTPALVRDVLLARGFGGSRMVVLAHMGGPRESRFEAMARDFTAKMPDFHTLCVECVAGPDAVWHPRTGISDDAFEHDGKLTKREIRAAALARLAPRHGALLVDVGAGCGSVAIEWLRAEDYTEAIALEPRADRRAMAARNAASLGVPHLDVRADAAPQALAGLPRPDAIFIGGGVSDATIAASLEKLNLGGRLVAHAVTLESEATLLGAHSQHGGELVRIAVTRAEPIGAFSGWRPAMPVTQWAWRKA